MAVQPVRGPSPADMMQAMIEKGVTQENAAAFKELVLLSEHMEDRRAARDFNESFVRLQAELPTIVAKTLIPNRGKYEKYEDILKVVGPLLTKNGFTVSFSNDFKDGRIIETCHLTFGTVTRSNSFAVRTRKADSDTQSDCMAATTAKRLAFCNALNIVIAQDMQTNENDVGLEGDPNAKVTPEQADELERRAQLTNSNIKAFLAYAKITKFADIPARLYPELDRMLAKKEREGK